METKGIFLVKDFEAQLWDVIETENQVADFPTNGFRYPSVTKDIGDLEVNLNWRVENMYNGNKIESIYSYITYSARIKGINGAFGGNLKQKYETYLN
jgi:hypothetical protein